MDILVSNMSNAVLKNYVKYKFLKCFQTFCTTTVKISSFDVSTGEESDHKFTQLKPRPGASDSVKEESSTKSLLIVALIFVGAIVTLGLVYLNFPKLEEWVGPADVGNKISGLAQDCGTPVHH